MDEEQSNLIAPFESSARVLYGTLMKTPALRILAERLDGSSSLQSDEKKENMFRINWIETMSGFTTGAKQLESTWMDIQPDVFSMSLVVPKDIVANQPTLMPQLLLTSLPREELGALHIPEKEKYSLQRLVGSKRSRNNEGADNEEIEEAERVLQSLIHSHNENMKAVRDEFSDAMDAWKKTVQQQQKKRIAVKPPINNSKDRNKMGSS